MHLIHGFMNDSCYIWEGKKSQLCLDIWVCLHAEQPWKALQLIKATALCLFASSSPAPMLRCLHLGPALAASTHLCTSLIHLDPLTAPSAKTQDHRRSEICIPRMDAPRMSRAELLENIECEVWSVGVEVNKNTRMFPWKTVIPVDSSFHMVHLKSLVTEPWNLKEGVLSSRRGFSISICIILYV